MKRVLVLLLMVLLVSLAACGNSAKTKDDSARAPTEKITEDSTEKAIEVPTKDQTDAETDSADTNAGKGSVFKGAISNIIVSLDGDNVSLYDKASVLLDNGWMFDGDHKLKSHTIMVSTVEKNGHRFSISLTNFTDSVSTFKESTITEIDISLRDNDFIIKDRDTVPDFTLNNIINNDSTKRDIIEAFGEPKQITNTEDYEKLIYEDSEYNQMFIFLLKKSNDKIGEVKLNINTNPIKLRQ